MLQSDATGILQRLLKYPPVEDIRVLTSMAKRYQSYILGGCVTAKPSVLPQQVSAPTPVSLLPTSEKSTAPVLFTAPIIPKKPTPDPLLRPREPREPNPPSPQPSLSPSAATSNPLIFPSVSPLPTANILSSPLPAPSSTSGPLSIPGEVRRSKFDRALLLIQEQLNRGALVPEELREALELLRQVKSEQRL